MEGLADWQSRPVYAVVFIDAIQVKIREGQVANRPIYLGAGRHGRRRADVVGLWEAAGFMITQARRGAAQKSAGEPGTRGPTWPE
jgi:hypothetical protein